MESSKLWSLKCGLWSSIIIIKNLQEMHLIWSPDLRNNRNSGWGLAIWFSSSQVVLMLLTFEKLGLPGIIPSSWRSIEPPEQ